MVVVGAVEHVEVVECGSGWGNGERHGIVDDLMLMIIKNLIVPWRQITWPYNKKPSTARTTIKLGEYGIV